MIGCSAERKLPHGMGHMDWEIVATKGFPPGIDAQKSLQSAELYLPRASSLRYFLNIGYVLREKN